MNRALEQSIPQIPEEKKSGLRVIIHSFFVVPLLIAFFALIIFLVLRLLTAEPSTARDYLNDVKIGGNTRRWQGAFELSKILSDPQKVPNDDRFVQDMINTFEHAQHDRDERIKYYLALAMGRTEDSRYVSTLARGLEDKDPNTVASCVYALGLIKDTVLLDKMDLLKNHNNAQVRLQLVIALGYLGNDSAIPILLEKLQDEEENVVWDAAVALAKLGNSSGRKILINLLDRNYFTSFPNIDEEEQAAAILVAIRTSVFIQNPELKKSLEVLKNGDKNFKIQEAARIALEQFN
ncbi:MAG: HEAT repeat domain-containing protein [Candidatus Neomarinimicrobiota bacterium]